MESKTTINKGFLRDLEIIGVVEAGGKLDGAFVYDGPAEDIETASAGCTPCTTIHKLVEMGNRTIIPFTYHDTHVSNDGFFREYPGGVANVTKSITVWFKDGVERFKENGRGAKVTNYDKEHTSLSYRVDVKG